MQWTKVCMPLGSTSSLSRIMVESVKFSRFWGIQKMRLLLWSSNPFCTTVCLITELIYLLHYLISSPSHTGPDENSDYCPSMGQGGEFNFHCLELGKRGIVQKMQGDWEMRRSRVCFFLHKLTLESVFNIIFLFIDQFLNRIWLSTHAYPHFSKHLLKAKIPYGCSIAWTALDCTLYCLNTHPQTHTTQWPVLFPCCSRIAVSGSL